MQTKTATKTALYTFVCTVLSAQSNDLHRGQSPDPISVTVSVCVCEGGGGQRTCVREYVCDVTSHCPNISIAVGSDLYPWRRGENMWTVFFLFLKFEYYSIFKYPLPPKKKTDNPSYAPHKLSIAKRFGLLFERERDRQTNRQNTVKIDRDSWR